jgi:hypothetical protein
MVEWNAGLTVLSVENHDADDWDVAAWCNRVKIDTMFWVLKRVLHVNVKVYTQVRGA